jgi:hypothetical protein
MVFNQVRGVGKLLTQDFRQLSSRGIISLVDIAKYFKVTEAKAQEMLSSGQVSFAKFRDILKSLTQEGGRFANMMEKQSVSLLGLKSTLNDARNIAIRTLAVPLVPFVKALTQGFISLANAVEAFVRNGGAVTSYAFAAATGISLLTASLLAASFAARVLGLSLYKTLVGTGIGIAIIAIAASIGALVGWLRESEGVQKRFWAFWESIKATVEPVIETFRRFVKENEVLFHDLLYVGGEILRDFGDLAASVFDKIVLGWSMLMSAMGISSQGIIRDLLAVVRTILVGLKEVLDWMSVVTSNWELLWVFFAVNARIAIAKFEQTAWTAFEGFRLLVNAVAVSIQTAFEVAFENIVKKAQQASALLVGAFRVLAVGMAVMAKGGSAAAEAAMNVQKGIERMRIRAADPGGLKDPLEEARKAFVGAMGAGRKDPFVDKIKSLEAARGRLLQEMEKNRERIRRSRTPSDLPADFGPQAKKDEEKKTPDAAAFLEAGRYGFVQLGTKIQDILLGKGKDHAAEQVDLLKAGLNKQDELIKAVKEPKAMGLV